MVVQIVVGSHLSSSHHGGKVAEGLLGAWKVDMTHLTGDWGLELQLDEKL